MNSFELVEPRSLREAISLLDPEDSGVRAIGGGTALMLMMKAGIFRPRRLVSLRRVEPHFSRIETGEDGELRIGALASLSAVERSALVQREAPVLPRTMRRLANVRVRNVATIGGNLGHADPHMDLPPVLCALGAQVLIVGPAGERTMPVDSLIAGYLQTTLGNNELIAALLIPPQGNRRVAYLKCTTRSADDWPALGVAVSLDLDGALVRSCTLVVGAATDRPTRLQAAESILRGMPVDAATLLRAGEAAADELTLAGDAQGSAAYKRQLVRVYLGRAVRAATTDGPL